MCLTWCSVCGNHSVNHRCDCTFAELATLGEAGAEEVTVLMGLRDAGQGKGPGQIPGS